MKESSLYEKKPLPILLETVMLLSLAAIAAADTWKHEAFGISIERPAGMTGEDISEDSLVALYVESDNGTAPTYFVFIERGPDFDGLWRETLAAEGYELADSAYDDIENLLAGSIPPEA